MTTYNKVCLTFGYVIHQLTPDPSMTAVTSWTIQYHCTDSDDDVMMQSHDADGVNEYELTGLDKGTSYTVLVAASNSAGMGPFTNQMVMTLIDRKRYFKVVFSL